MDTFTTVLLAAGVQVPADRQIDGMDMRDFLLGAADASGRDTVLCLQGNRLQAVKWRQWKIHLFKQDDSLSTWTPYNGPHLHNLEWDLREEHQVDFPHAWVLHPMAAAVGAFLRTLATEPPIKPGTPDPYLPPRPGELPGGAPTDWHNHAVHHVSHENARGVATGTHRAGSSCGMNRARAGRFVQHMRR